MTEVYREEQSFCYVGNATAKKNFDLNTCFGLVYLESEYAPNLSKHDIALSDMQGHLSSLEINSKKKKTTFIIWGC